MSNGQAFYGGQQSAGTDDASGFGGATMGGGQVFGTQRPLFGQQPVQVPQQNPYGPSGGPAHPGMFSPQQQQQQQQPQGFSQGYSQFAGQPAPSTPTPSNTGPYQQLTPQQQQQHPPGHPAGTGSISRFATPTQQPPGSTMYGQSSPYGFQSPSPGAMAPAPNMAMSGSNMSYANRGAALYGSQQNQPQQQPQMYGAAPQQPQQQQQQQQPQPPANTAGMSFAQRSAMMRQNQPPRSNVYGGAQQPPPQPQNSGMYAQQQQQPNRFQQPPGTPQQQQQQQFQGNMGQPGMPQLAQPQQRPVYGGAPMPTQQQQQQPQPSMEQSHQQPQQQGTSYAQRSAMMGQSQMGGMPQQQMQPAMPQQHPGMVVTPQQQPPAKPNIYIDPPEVVAQQNRLLTDATRKVQEHAYYMKQAMERNDLPTVLDRAASMVGELGEHAHSHHHHTLHPPAPGASGTTTALNPKNYYELHLRALEELPTLEDYLLNVAQGNQNTLPGTPAPGMAVAPGMMPQSTQPQAAFTMKQLYDYVQYCPNVLSRLYLQICAASALIRSGEVGARWVLKDMIEAVKCVQNPVRGLFLRHYLLQATRGALPDDPIPAEEIALDHPPTAAAAAAENTSAVDSTPTPAVVANVSDSEKGNVKDSYQFILANFVEMNKLWVRIQNLPGDGKSKEIRRRREKDRNELRVLVGTNMVRLSALNSVTSQIYGQVILPTVLDHIVACGDPLAQAYLIDCIVQVFPDEYHIETMPILLAVCPKLRDKVNIRTILQSLMDRLANYLADEELLDEKDSNQVKRAMAQDSFRMIDECVQSVYNARGPKLQAKEVIRLQTALLSFTMKCYQGNLEQVSLCLDNCVVALQQARANQALMLEARNPQYHNNGPRTIPQLDEVAASELEKLLSIPLEELALGVLTLDHYSDLIGFLPWASRRKVALNMLEAVSKAGAPPKSIGEIEELFSLIAPVLRDEHDNVPGPTTAQDQAMDRTANLMAGLGVTPHSGNNQFAQQGGTYATVPDLAQYRQDAALVSKLIHLLENPDTDVQYEMLTVARNHLNSGKLERTGTAYVALVFAALKLARRILLEESQEKQEEPSGDAIEATSSTGEEAPAKGPENTSSESAETIDDKTTEEPETNVENQDSPSSKDEEGTLEAEPETVPGANGVETGNNDEGAEVAAGPTLEGVGAEKAEATNEQPKTAKAISFRKVFVFVQQVIASLAKGQPEKAVKLYLESALTADKMGQASGQDALGCIAYELISQSYALYEEHASESKLQSRCIVEMIGTLLACRSLGKEDYESLVMKTAQYSAKMLKKPEQCAMVAQCSHLFYVVGREGEVVYSNPQRSLECLQRGLKLADACTTSNPANVQLFVDLLDHYLFFYEKKHPLITGNYITGLVALIKEHTDNLGQFGGMNSSSVGEAKSHFVRLVRHIKMMAEKPDSKERFAGIDVSGVST